MNLLKKLGLGRILFFACAFLFLLLLFKNPFSERNLISNLEPYPDTIHYLTPAINFTQGRGFYIEREGRQKTLNVPLLYSVSLMPLFLINQDVRIFYFTNILLAFSGLYILYKICEKLFKNQYILGFVLFLYVTNYFIYWFPTLAMAENLLVPLFLFSVLMLLEKVTIKKALLAGLLVLSFYATKYANIPLSAALFILYILKIFFGKNKKPKKIKLLSFFVLSSTLAFTTFFLFEYFSKGANIISVVSYFLPFSYGETNPVEKIDALHEPWFARKYFYSHFLIYLSSVIGQPIKLLWNMTPIIPNFAGFLGLVGLVAGLFYKQYRFVVFCLLTFLFSQILFMSTFYSIDGRYIYYAIPLLLISFGIFLTIFDNYLLKHKIKYSNIMRYCFLGFLFLFYLYITFARIKYQIALNIKHTETPWYYVSVKVANSFFDTLPKVTPNKYILISALPPYYVDFFSNNRYRLLPLSPAQEFLKEKKQVWGIEEDADFIRLYANYIEEGYEVYISNYGLSDIVYLHNDYNKIKAGFNLIKVYEGCFNACNIYKLELRND